MLRLCLRLIQIIVILSIVVLSFNVDFFVFVFTVRLNVYLALAIDLVDPLFFLQNVFLVNGIIVDLFKTATIPEPQVWQHKHESALNVIHVCVTLAFSQLPKNRVLVLEHLVHIVPTFEFCFLQSVSWFRRGSLKSACIGQTSTPASRICLVSVWSTFACRRISPHALNEASTRVHIFVFQSFVSSRSSKGPAPQRMVEFREASCRMF